MALLGSNAVKRKVFTSCKVEKRVHTYKDDDQKIYGDKKQRCKYCGELLKK